MDDWALLEALLAAPGTAGRCRCGCGCSSRAASPTSKRMDPHRRPVARGRGREVLRRRLARSPHGGDGARRSPTTPTTTGDAVPRRRQAWLAGPIRYAEAGGADRHPRHRRPRASRPCSTPTRRSTGSDSAAAAPAIEHAQVLRPELVRRMADLGVVGVHPAGLRRARRRRPPGGPGRRAHGGRPTAGSAARRRRAGDRRVRPPDRGAVAPPWPRSGWSRASWGRSTVAPRRYLDAALALMTDATAGTAVLSDDPAASPRRSWPSIEVVETRPAG